MSCQRSFLLMFIEIEKEHYDKILLRDNFIIKNLQNFDFHQRSSRNPEVAASEVSPTLYSKIDGDLSK